MKIQCIMKYVYMEIYVYYVIWLHADTHVLCNTFTWRYTCIMPTHCKEQWTESDHNEVLWWSEQLLNRMWRLSAIALHQPLGQYECRDTLSSLEKNQKWGRCHCKACHQNPCSYLPGKQMWSGTWADWVSARQIESPAEISSREFAKFPLRWWSQSQGHHTCQTIHRCTVTPGC